MRLRAQEARDQIVPLCKVAKLEEQKEERDLRHISRGVKHNGVERPGRLVHHLAAHLLVLQDQRQDERPTLLQEGTSSSP